VLSSIFGSVGKKIDQSSSNGTFGDAQVGHLDPFKVDCLKYSTTVLLNKVWGLQSSFVINTL